MLRHWMRVGALGAAVLIGPAVLAQNRPPTADAGVDRFTYVGLALQLNGMGTDADGDVIRDVLWQVESTPPGAQYYLEAPNYPFSMFAGYAAGRYGLSYSVFDGLAWSAPDTMEVLAVLNQAPIARIAPVPATGRAPFTVNFDGSSSSDPEGRPLNYHWSFGDGSDGSYDISGTHVYDSPGTFSVTLVVTDEMGVTDFDVAVVGIQPMNFPPRASPLVELLVGHRAQFKAGADDPNYDPLTYLWDFGDPASPDNLSTLADPVHWFSQPGHYVTTLTVDDGEFSTRVQMALDIGQVPEPGGWVLSATALLAMAAVPSRRRWRVRQPA